MAYGMTTKFTDTNGEEFTFLGTSISYSEKELLNLEQEHDKLCEKAVEELLSDGYFEEEWTDYYAETDDDDCEDDYDDYVDKEIIDECNKENYDNNNNNNNEYILSQSNVPLFSVTREILNVATFHQNKHKQYDNKNNSSQNQFIQLPLSEEQLQCVSTKKHYLHVNVNVNGIYIQMIKVIN